MKKLLETVADIAYYAGYSKYFSGDSRYDIENIINYAKEFRRIHKRTDWDKIDYISTVSEYAKNKLKTCAKI